MMIGKMTPSRSRNVYVISHDHTVVVFYYLEDPGIIEGGEVPDVGE